MSANLDIIRTNHAQSATRAAWDVVEIRVIVSFVPVIDHCGRDTLVSSKHKYACVIARWVMLGSVEIKQDTLCRLRI